MKITRDSLLWTVGLFGSVAAALSTGMGEHGPFAWLSESAKHAILMVSSVTGAVSGFMKTSPLSLSVEGQVKEQFEQMGKSGPAQPPVLPPSA